MFKVLAKHLSLRKLSHFIQSNSKIFFFLYFTEDHSPSFNDATINKLRALNVNIEGLSPPYTSVNVVEKILDDITSYSDSRGGGASSKFR